MSIDIPQKGDKIFIRLAGLSAGDYCVVIDWDIEAYNQNWAVLLNNDVKFQVNISQIVNYSVLKHPPKEDKIRSKIVKPVELDPDPSSELKGITDPTLRALKLADLRKHQQELKMSDIKDHMKSSETQVTKHNYEMPSFKKCSGK